MVFVVYFILQYVSKCHCGCIYQGSNNVKQEKKPINTVKTTTTKICLPRVQTEANNTLCPLLHNYDDKKTLTI
jgi:hypothetical protein